MVEAQVFDEYIHFSLMYTTDNIFHILPIKHLANQDGELTTTHNIATGSKPFFFKYTYLLFPCVIWKSTAHVNMKALHMCNQSQKNLGVSSMEFHKIKKDNSYKYLVRKI